MKVSGVSIAWCVALLLYSYPANATAGLKTELLTQDSLIEHVDVDGNAYGLVVSKTCGSDSSYYYLRCDNDGTIIDSKLLLQTTSPRTTNIHARIYPSQPIAKASRLNNETVLAWIDLESGIQIISVASGKTVTLRDIIPSEINDFFLIPSDDGGIVAVHAYKDTAEGRIRSVYIYRFRNGEWQIYNKYNIQDTAIRFKHFAPTDNGLLGWWVRSDYSSMVDVAGYALFSKENESVILVDVFRGNLSLKLSAIQGFAGPCIVEEWKNAQNGNGVYSIIAPSDDGARIYPVSSSENDPQCDSASFIRFRSQPEVVWGILPSIDKTSVVAYSPEFTRRIELPFHTLHSIRIINEKDKCIIIGIAGNRITTKDITGHIIEMRNAGFNQELKRADVAK